MNLSEHFTLEEMIRSDYAIRNNIDNTPSDEVVANLISLCENKLEPLRNIVGKPIHILSGYRCEALNTAIGGAKDSQHRIGEAADIAVEGYTVDELFNTIWMNIEFDQLIQEFNRWVHISNSLVLRNERLWAVKQDGKTVYLHQEPSKV